MIIGVSLTGDPERLGKALKRLKNNNVRVSWISAIPAPKSISKEIRSMLEIFVGGSIVTEAVSLCYNLPCAKIMPITNEDKSSKKVLPYHQLLDAAMYFYRNYQDQKTYGNAIRHIAKLEEDSSLSESELEIIEHYKRYGNRELVGNSPEMLELLKKIDLAAKHPHARVLIYGESGTGKETVALQIHNKSSLRGEPFIAFNCASVTPNLLESRFLGYDKGAFSGADKDKPGLFEYANGGTLFLDEIGELPLEAQGVLLRVLEGGRFTHLGGNKEIEVNVRLLTATNRNLSEMVREGRFRLDLFYRLNVVQLRVPALREHKSDIAKIANSYRRKLGEKGLTPEQIKVLKSYDYPGNVRELFNLLERASVWGESNFSQLLEEHKQMNLGLECATMVDAPPSDELDAVVRWHIRRVYKKNNENLSKTKDVLKSSRNTVKKYLEEN